MKESKWFSTVVFTILLGVNGLSFLLMQWQKVSQNRLMIAMGVLILLSLTYLFIMNRSKTRSKKNRFDK